MTLSLSQLHDKVAKKFPGVEKINSSTLRFMKGAKGSPYAVYYLDIVQNLPKSKEALANYLDRVIGAHYFKDRKSLQWSNYLYFITQLDKNNSYDLQNVKDLIERDRNYARKFVISVEDVDSILTSPVVVPQAATPHANVLSVWSKMLTDAGLDKVILHDADLPTRLKLIESSRVERTSREKRRKISVADRKETFIRSLNLNKFRDFPRQKNFSFGTVNLIFGANGSGKTSLFEAIELYYCGKNKRNPKSHPQYEIAVGFAGGRSEIATSKRTLQLFRDRNLIWYGQPETNTQNLYQSFSQFNFLNTDAAVGLADSVTRIKDDLSKLLVGPDASKIWRDIEKVTEAVLGKVRDLTSLETQINEELSALDKQIKASNEIHQESDSIHARLKEMINRIGWNHGKVDKETSASLVEILSEFVSILHQVENLNWTKSPVSINTIDEYCCNARIVSVQVKRNLIQMGQMQNSQKEILDLINRDRKAIELAKEAKRIVESGVIGRSEDCNKQRDLIASYSGKLAGIETVSLHKLFADYLDMGLLACREVALVKSSSAKTLLDDTMAEYEEFCKLRDQSLNLIQELKQIADRIIHNSSKFDECPLCHTTFEQGELSNRINVNDDHFSSIGRKLLDQIQERELVLDKAKLFDAVLVSLLKFCERSKLSQEITIRSVLAEIERTKKLLSEAQDKLSLSNGEILTLESHGFTVKRAEEVSLRLQGLGHPISGFLLEDIDRLILDISGSLLGLSDDFNNKKIAIEELNLEILESLGTIGLDDSELKNLQFQLEERLVLTESILEKLRYFTASDFPWPRDRPIAELFVEAESIRKVATDMKLALGKETRAKDIFTKSISRRDDLQKKLKDLQLRLDRYRQAKDTFNKIRNKHSLQSAMDFTLRENRDCIETIFKSIHSPVEFRGLGQDWSTLVRKQGGHEAKLSEISTGQRAAFALSIFLAQNIQLKDAPPVILIDDPIAHVDDLNSLSYLDYLREIVLKGQRQIFFSTADDKLAALFQRKFDFLGSEEFRRINLVRES